MNTLERQSMALYATIGGGVGFLAGVIPPVALEWGVGFALPAMSVGAILGIGFGVWVGNLLNRRFPPMLPFHAQEHKRLREVANQVRKNLRRLTGSKSEYPELETVLKQDVQLRVQASELRLQLDAKARAALNWGDYLAAGIETLRRGGWRELLAVIFDSVREQSEGETSPSNARSEWMWGVYSDKLQRELQRIQARRAQAQSNAAQDALQYAYAQKERELESFYAAERAMRELESVSAAIGAQIEHLHTETIRLSAQPQSAVSQVDALLQPLRQQVEAYDQAVSEIQSVSVESRSE